MQENIGPFVLISWVIGALLAWSLVRAGAIRAAQQEKLNEQLGQQFPNVLPLLSEKSSISDDEIQNSLVKISEKL